VNVTQAEAEVYWTPQRLMHAKPMEMHPRVGANGRPEAPQIAPDNSPSVRAEGSRPTATAARLEKTLIPEVYLQPDAFGRTDRTEGSASIIPNATKHWRVHKNSHL
jgi:hypothetical protein